MLPRRQRVSGAWFAYAKRTHPHPHAVAATRAAEVRVYPPFPCGERRPRIGVIVGRRIARTSVARHRLKRRIYAAVRSCLDALPPGTYIIHASERAQTLSFRELERELCDALCSVASSFRNNALS